MSDTAAATLLISGIVQGVGYRAWTVRAAAELELRGWVRNLHDGRVEIWAEGSSAAIDALEARCRIGPRSGQVTAVERAPRAPRGHTGFEERRTAEGPE